MEMENTGVEKQQHRNTVANPPPPCGDIFFISRLESRYQKVLQHWVKIHVTSLNSDSHFPSLCHDIVAQTVQLGRWPGKSTYGLNTTNPS